MTSLQNQRYFETTVDTVKDAIAKVQGAKFPFNKKKALHFADLRHEARKFYTAQIATQPFTAISIIIHKRLFTDKQSQIGPRHLYDYASGELIKRILLWCSEQQTANTRGDGTIQLVFSNRSALNCALLSEYYEQLFSIAPEIAPLISKHFRKEQVLALPHSKRAGLQVADAVASSFGKSLEENTYGQAEESYRNSLMPIIRCIPDIIVSARMSADVFYPEYINLIRKTYRLSYPHDALPGRPSCPPRLPTHPLTW